jgi:chemotaxis protein MotB
MSAAARSGGRRRRGHDAGHESEERWLLTYADMITLLLALFVVLFSISSVNISKFKTLQEALRDAFSGRVLSGGHAILQTSNDTSVTTPQTAPPKIVPSTPSIGTPKTAAARQALAARREQDEFRQLKRQLDAFAAAHGFADRVQTIVARRGLVVRLLTDRVLFDSGLANLKPQGLPLLTEVASLLGVDRAHPILVEGNTDDVPISTSQYASNWELSTARATDVVRFLIHRGLATRRFGAAGYADLHPVASNATAAGRARNRRVEIVLQRLHYQPTGEPLGVASPKGSP